MTTSNETYLASEVHLCIKNEMALDPFIPNGNIFSFIKKLESHSIIGHILFDQKTQISHPLVV